jgi:hypothetical protein
MCQYAFDLRLVPLPQLDNGSGCEGGQHGEIVPASVRSAPDSGGPIHRSRRYTEVQLCVLCSRRMSQSYRSSPLSPVNRVSEGAALA